MLNKSTMIKIAVAVLVVAIIWFVMRLRKASKPKVIVTAMPVMNEPVGYVNDLPLDNEDDDYADIPSPKKEGYSDWEADDAGDVEEESFVEYSNPNFKSDLLEQ